MAGMRKLDWAATKREAWTASGAMFEGGQHALVLSVGVIVCCDCELDD